MMLRFHTSLFVFSALAVICTAQKLSDGDSIFRCSELNDLTEMTKCFRKRFSESARKSDSSSSHSNSYQGFPFQVAPLPPYLVPESAVQPNRRIGNLPTQRRMQGYTVPTYRNYLDLDIPTTSGVVEFRPVYDSYAVPVLMYESKDYYAKPQGKKYRKGQDKYSALKYNTDGQSKYKYNVKESHHSHTKSYKEDYYVPAHSPIMGDIRRSLMDYTGSLDLTVDEPEYVIQRRTIEAMGNDFFPFRRNFDLQFNESKRYQNRKPANKP